MNKTERKTKATPVPIESDEEKRGNGPETEGAEPKTEDPIADELLGLDQIKELIELVAARDFNEFELERGRFRLRLRRGVRVTDAPVPDAPAVGAVAASAATSSATVAPTPEEVLHIVSSPIVGTYYSAASPASEQFVRIGDPVQSGQTLCIIEAMKLMNEIQSDASGILARIFVENGQPVEFGQPLFGIRIG